MFNQIKKISVAAALLAALPAVASAQSVAFGNAPVTLNACSVTPQLDRLSFVGPIDRGSALLHNENAFDLNYVDTANVAATSITFVLNDGKRTESFTARGNFAPGVNTDASFTANSDAQPTTAVACSVAQVRFADGHVWQAVPGQVGLR
jgi:hypothetical protein